MGKAAPNVRFISLFYYFEVTGALHLSKAITLIFLIYPDVKLLL